MDSKPQQYSSPETLHDIFSRGLYDINPIHKSLTRPLLSLAYSPGVGYVCKDIEAKPELLDSLTLRGRSVAVVTQGNMFSDNSLDAGRMMPIVDWAISQIKFYSEVDGFPFLLRKKANLPNALKDLSNSYGCILLLDDIHLEEQDLPTDCGVLFQSDVQKATKKSNKTDCEATGYILAKALREKKYGRISHEYIESGLSFRPRCFKQDESYFVKMDSGKSTNQKAFDLHEKFNGKIQIELSFGNIDFLKEHFNDAKLIEFCKNNTFFKTGYNRISAIVTDGTSILGYGDIGPRAGLPVMQGKSLLFKALGGVSVVPVCINKRPTTDEAIEAILDLTSYFKAINLEDIKAPECFAIERTISNMQVIPVFHDDQHGTAIVTLAGLINAAKIRQTPLSEMKILINGAGAAGITIANLLLDYGVKELIVCDSKGAIYEGRAVGMNEEKNEVAKKTNLNKIEGGLDKVIEGIDVFIGVSVANALKKEWAQKMNKNSIIFAMANPDPEILPQDAYESGALIYGSGRSDYENQINNSLVFPGIFRGIHIHDLPAITNEMKLTTGELIAASMEGNISRKNIIPDSIDRDVPVNVADGLEKFKDA